MKAAENFAAFLSLINDQFFINEREWHVICGHDHTIFEEGEDITFNL